MKQFNEVFTQENLNEGFFGNLLNGLKGAVNTFKQEYAVASEEQSKAEAAIIQSKLPTIIQSITDKITADTKTISDKIDSTLKQDANAYNGANKNIIVAAIISASLDSALTKLRSEVLASKQIKECYTEEQIKMLIEGVGSWFADKVIGKGTAQAYADQKIVWSKNDTQKIGNDLSMFLQKQSGILIAQIEASMKKSPGEWTGKVAKREAFNMITAAINTIKSSLAKTAGVKVKKYPRLPSFKPKPVSKPIATKPIAKPKPTVTKPPTEKPPDSTPQVTSSEEARSKAELKNTKSTSE